MKYVDLTQVLRAGMPVFPGDPPVELKTATTSPQVTEVVFGTHSGTHLDAPSHFFSGGKKLSDFGVESFMGKGVLLDARGEKNIGKEILQGAQINAGDIVLLCTGWQEKYGSGEYFEDHPLVSDELAKELVRLQIKMLGMDTPSPDKEPFLVHEALLQKEILILENLRKLEGLLTAKNFEIIALPLKLEADGAPTRVVAKIYE
ncbi:MAG: cyclase family protein [Patescibacteria group bacterium]|nr:cyclase family protein [Patescibacteria group bacterium]